VPAVALASAYGTRAYEVGAMQRALGPHMTAGSRLYYRLWLRWIKAVDDRIERRGYRGADTVLVNYESVERILCHAYGSDLALRRIPYAPVSAFDDDAERPARKARSRTPLILAVSRHDPRKGIDVLLRALVELRARSIEFRACLVGPGALLESHRRMATSLGLDGHVQITGPVEDVEPYLAAADVYVLPSLAEASGSVSLLEAMRAELPIIASACDGIPEDLNDGVDALLVPPGEPVRLAGALAALLADGDLRARLATAGRLAYEQRFSAARFTEALAGVYASAIEGRRRRRR
jgi:glycosyltransferase involved in cell wall biosynthesis